MTNSSILIVAAGRGHRAGGDLPKQYVKLDGQFILSRTIKAFIAHPLVDQVLVVIHADDRKLYEAATAEFGSKLLSPVLGGSSRQDSVLNGLRAFSAHRPDQVLIHDAARPFVDPQLIKRVIKGLAACDAVIPVLQVTDTIKSVDNGLISKTVDRARLYGAQTPQGFRFPLILDLHERAQNVSDIAFTDDASIFEWAGNEVRTVKGAPQNTKITTKTDMELAELALGRLEKRTMETHTGFGYDVHRFEPGDGVILCGIKIPFSKKLKGHSDADVAMHALTDALLGAIGEGDIGMHFPPRRAKMERRRLNRVSRTCR